ncbi:hypothetical protein ACFWNL_18240 [Kitasatospora sp. NPDC058397]|uniref:hypothetical protein n=1 Tax=unclassified Kitasatospora TaxID=2633591 RepID=UPI00365A89FA
MDTTTTEPRTEAMAEAGEATVTDAATFDRLLADALARVAEELGRTNTKASLLLATDGVLINAVASIRDAHPVALTLAAIGTFAMVSGAILALLVVMPRLDKDASGGFIRWARCEGNVDLRAALIDDDRLGQLGRLSALCTHKMRLLISSSLLSVAAIVSVGPAALAAAF